MIKQVLEPLYILKDKKYGFCHNDLKTRNVFVSGTIKDPIFKIADFDKSSIFWNRIRFCNTLRSKSKLYQLALEFWYKGFEIKSHNNIVTYKLNKEYVTGENAGLIMYSWFPMFMAHDIYTFIISIIHEPIVWDLFSHGLESVREFGSNNIRVIPRPYKGFNYPKLYHILSILFGSQLDSLLIYMDELHMRMKSTIDNEKERNNTLRSISTINSTLSNFYLNIDISSLYESTGISNTYSKYTHTSKYQYYIDTKPFLSTYDNHICTSECINGKCSTNTYSKTSIYNFDTCKI